MIKNNKNHIKESAFFIYPVGTAIGTLYNFQNWKKKKKHR